MKFWLLLTGSSLAALPALAHAQTQADPPSKATAKQAAPSASDQSGAATNGSALPDPNTTASSDGDIVVTAQKRSQRLMDVPVPISVVGSAQLESAGITNVSDITRLTTGTVFAKNGAWAQPTIRGVGTKSSAAGDSSNVAIYVDGVYLAAQQAGFTDFNNIERIEVLKGPQGTLFGRNATGGAISIVTRTPTQDFTLDGSASYGSYDRRVGKLYVGGGLADGLAADIALSYDRDDGYTRDLLTDARLRSSNNFGVRSKVKWDLSDIFTVTFSGDYGKYRNNQAYAYTAVNGNNSVLRTSPATAIVGVRRGDVALSFLPYTSIEQGGGSVTADLDLSAFTLRSISAYRETHQKALLDSDTSNLNNTASFIDSPGRTFTEELVLATPAADRLSMVAGVFILDDQARRTPTRTITTTVSNTVVNARAFAVAPYGEATFRVSDRFSVIGGLRYSYESRSLRNYLNGAPRANASKDYNHVDYRATLRYEVNSDLNFYATKSTGFKSGVFNTSAFDGIAIKPETIDAWELGFKSNLAGLSVSGDAFYYDYKDIQIQRSTNPLTGQTALQNAASARIKGVELEARGRIVEGLSANLGVTYLDAHYRRFPAADVLVPVPGGGNRSAAVDASGNPLIRTPKWTVSSGLDYHAPLFGGTLNLSANYYYTSSFAWEPSNRVRQPSYSLVGGQIGWTAPGGGYTLTVFGDNLTDETYYENVNTSTTGDTGVYAAPRRFGVRLNVHLD